MLNSCRDLLAGSRARLSRIGWDSCVCVCVCVCSPLLFTGWRPPIEENHSTHYASRLFSPSFSLHTHTSVCKHTQHILIWFFPNAWSQWSIVWVLFSMVTGGWDNGAQLNCAQLIYFLSVKTNWLHSQGWWSESQNPTKWSTEWDRQRRNLILTKVCQLQPQLLGSFPFVPHHLDNTIFSLGYIKLT